MAKTIFIATGFKEAASDSQYDWLRQFFAEQGFTVRIPNIIWSRKVMSDYVSQFEEYYTKYATDTNCILGFSCGAMIALITAQKFRPDRLLLCSLSPYFAEDLPTMRPSWKTILGHRRVTDFANFSARALANQIAMPTNVFYGTVEAKYYPQLKNRCEETAARIPHATITAVPDAPHQIDYPTYVTAIKAAFKES
jgi:esterase/lipase